MSANTENVSSDIKEHAEKVTTTQRAKIQAKETHRSTDRRQWLSTAWKEVKPWSDFITCSKFSRPNGMADVGKRLIVNVKYYRWNYIFITLFLMIFCIITSPLLLFALCATLAGCYWINYRCQGEKVKVCGYEFDKTEQYGIVCLVTLPLYVIASAGSTLFWLIGFVVFLVCFHASFTATVEEEDDPTGIELA